MDRPPLRFVNPTDFRCPFCNGKFMIGDPDRSDPAVAHGAPACSTFVRLDPVAFLRAARKAGAVPLG